ncbi:MAG TPA: trypsin-like peptidase domain-containing protein, partial [Nitrospiraceae bacterium]|nr:trypsin-like peptidase domain-containing protein [Nitrospiraceae bacterium]
MEAAGFFLLHHLGTVLKGRRFKVGVVLSCVVCLWTPAAGFAHTSGELYRQAKAATALIVGIDDDTQSLSFGSGVFVSADGTIITNAHVIKDATRLFVYSLNQEVDTQPEILAVEPDWDLAALRVATPRPAAFLP